MAVGLQIGGGVVLVLRGCVGVDVKNVSFSTVSGFETAEIVKLLFIERLLLHCQRDKKTENCRERL